LRGLVKTGDFSNEDGLTETEEYGPLLVPTPLYMLANRGAGSGGPIRVVDILAEGKPYHRPYTTTIANNNHQDMKKIFVKIFVKTYDSMRLKE